MIKENYEKIKLFDTLHGPGGGAPATTNVNLRDCSEILKSIERLP